MISKKGLKMSALIAVALSGAVLYAACAQAADSGLSHQDKSFMKSAAEAGNTEVVASKLALEKSSNPAVKAFAQKMVDEHSKIGDDLKKLADTKKVTVSDKPSLTQRAKIDVLGKFSGTSFDKHYVSMIGVSAHKDAVALFDKESQKGQDADVKQFATDTLPALKGHLAMANDLESTVSAEK